MLLFSVSLLYRNRTNLRTRILHQRYHHVFPLPRYHAKPFGQRGGGRHRLRRGRTLSPAFGDGKGHGHANQAAQRHTTHQPRIAKGLDGPAQTDGHDGKGQTAAAAGGPIVNLIALCVQTGDPAAAHILNAVDKHPRQQRTKGQRRNGRGADDADVQKRRRKTADHVKDTVAVIAVT